MTNRYSILIRKPDYEWLTWDNFTIASQSLSGAAFKIYVYLCSEEPNKIIYYSPTRLQNELGISNSSSHRAFSELISNHYLNTTTEEGFYIFTPMQVEQF